MCDEKHGISCQSRGSREGHPWCSNIVSTRGGSRARCSLADFRPTPGVGSCQCTFSIRRKSDATGGPGTAVVSHSTNTTDCLAHEVHPCAASEEELGHSSPVSFACSTLTRFSVCWVWALAHATLALDDLFHMNVLPHCSFGQLHRCYPWSRKIFS